MNRDGEAGELAVIFDRNDRFLAAGFYDPHSPIRVRILHRGKPVNLDVQWWKQRLAESIAKRKEVFDAGTNAGRWIHGENDSFPALVLDRYAETLVLKLYSAVWFPRLEEIRGLFLEAFHPARLVLRLSRNIQSEAGRIGLFDGQILEGDSPPGPVPFLETSLTFEADVLKGQKTGFFLDQRENRRRVEQFARGSDMLNAFSFSGGFSLYGARGGARSVTDVDISAHALESSKRNFVHNAAAVGNCTHALIQADVFEWLKTSAPAKYNLVVLDPPSLAKRESERAGALKAYAALAQAGLRVAQKSAVMVCCSCSAHVSADEFFTVIQETVGKSNRPWTVLLTALEPPDHHASFPEAAYLKAIYLRLG